MTLPVPVAEYSFDEASGAVKDLTGNGHNFSLSGNAVRDAGGHTNKGLTQSSTGAAAGPTMFGQSANRTMMMWVKMPADFTGWVFEYHFNTADTGGWGLLCLSGNIGYRARNASAATFFASMSRPTDSAWHHYAATINGTSLQLYHNGVASGSPVTVTGGVSTNADIINMFNITLGTTPMVDELRIYDQALDQATIATLMNIRVVSPLASWNFDESSGSALDISGNGNAIAMVGSTTRVSGRNGSGLTQSSFEQINTQGAFGQTANRTLMMAIKSISSVSDGRILASTSSVDANFLWEFLLRDSAWHIQAWNGSTFGRATFTRPTDSAWHHWCGTYDGTNIKAYLDGTLQATTALAGPIRSDADGFISLYQTGPNTIIDDAQMFDVALTQSEIQAMMNTPVGGTPPAPAGTNVYFSNGTQASGVYEMTTGGVLVQRNSIIIK